MLKLNNHPNLSLYLIYMPSVVDKLPRFGIGGCKFEPKRLWGIHGGNACVRSAYPADVVVTHMAVSWNPLRASSPTAGLLQTIGVGNTARRAGMHSVLKMGPNQFAVRGGGQTQTRIVQRKTSLSSLQRMESEKKLSTRTPRSLTT